MRYLTDFRYRQRQPQFHSEQAEDPEKIVRMITQEMQDTFVEVRSASARHLADERQLEKQLRHIRRVRRLERKRSLLSTRAETTWQRQRCVRSHTDEAQTQAEKILLTST